MLVEFFCRSPGLGALFVAWVGAVCIVLHAIVHAWIKWAVNRWFKEFYDILELAGSISVNTTATTADWQARQADVYAGLGEFCTIALVAVIAMPIARYIRSMWTLRWRLALMHTYIHQWNPNSPPIEGASQRVHEDAFRFAKGVELCLSTVLDAVITLCVFIPVLTDLGSQTPCPQSMSAFSLMNSGWLVGIAVCSAVVGVLVTVVLGRKLVGLEIDNQVIEAKLRRDLVVLETTPGKVCALHHLVDSSVVDGSAIARPDSSETATHYSMGDSVSSAAFLAPLPHFQPILDGIRKNYYRLYLNFTILNLWLALFDQFNVILPYLLFAPLLFDPDPHARIKLGTLVQVSNAFDKVFGAMSIVSENYSGINEFRSVLVRLRQFENNIFFEDHPTRKPPWTPIVRTMRMTNTRFGQPTEIELATPDVAMRADGMRSSHV